MSAADETTDRIENEVSSEEGGAHVEDSMTQCVSLPQPVSKKTTSACAPAAQRHGLSLIERYDRLTASVLQIPPSALFLVEALVYGLDLTALADVAAVLREAIESEAGLQGGNLLDLENPDDTRQPGE